MEYLFTKGKRGGFTLTLIVLGVWTLFVIVTFLSPTDQASSRYGLTPTQINFVRGTIVLPYLFIWLTLLTAIIRFRNYTTLVANSLEGEGFKRMTRVLWLLLGVLILPPFINLISTYAPQLRKFVVITSQYTSIVLYFLAFWQLYVASGHFLNTLHTRINYAKKWKPIVVSGMIVLTTFYVRLLFLNPYRTTSADPRILPTYFLPDWLIVLTILLPYIAIWLYGFLGVANILDYSKNVSGNIYRKAFNRIAVGFGIITLLLITLQLLSQVGAFQGRATITVVLILVYIILLIIAFQYLFIAKGAKLLTDIEKV
ncbi:MAG TPA: hypothetical protein VEA59_00995 [Patescibacteria group bacterium]|nr:hypothetical protein [Patescibacteria group bacterium]